MLGCGVRSSTAQCIDYKDIIALRFRRKGGVRKPAEEAAVFVSTAAPWENLKASEKM